MKESEATEILRLLTAGFHRESLEPDTIALWVEMLIGCDAEAATHVALRAVKHGDRFPTIKQFLDDHRNERARNRPPEIDWEPVEVDARSGLPTRQAPEWVKRWHRARYVDRDDRVFEEQTFMFTDAEIEERGGRMPVDSA